MTPNKFETKFGKDVPMTKYSDYWHRYQQQFQKQANQLAKELSSAYAKNPKAGDPSEVYAKLAKSGGAEFRDPWGSGLTFEPARWDPSKNYYVMRSAGPDRQPDTADDLQAVLLFQRKWFANPPDQGATKIKVNIEHDRGALNGRAEVVGTVTDQSGAVVAGADVELRSMAGRTIRTATADATGKFSFSGLPKGDYVIQVLRQGFRQAAQVLTLEARDRAVLSTVLSVGQASEVVEVTGANVGVQTDQAAMVVSTAPGVGGGIGAAHGGGTGGAMFKVGGARDMKDLAVTGRSVMDLVAVNGAVLAKESSAARCARALLFSRGALYQSRNHHRQGRARQHRDSDGGLHYHVAHGDDCLHATGSAWHLYIEPESFPGFLRRSRFAGHAHAGRSGFDSGCYLQLLGFARRCESCSFRTDDWFALVDDSGEKSVTVDSARVGSSQFTLEAKRIGKFKLTLAARMKGGADRADNDRADIVVREIEVIPNGREQSLVFNGRLENTVQHELDFPADLNS